MSRRPAPQQKGPVVTLCGDKSNSSWASLKMPLRIFAILFGISVALCSCGSSGLICDEDSPQVARARSLPQERLARLFTDALNAVARAEKGERSSSDKARVPPEFADLSPNKVLSFGTRRVVVVMKHCMDHGVFLNIRIPENDRGSITLSWGEHAPDSGEQVLWRQP